MAMHSHGMCQMSACLQMQSARPIVCTVVPALIAFTCPRWRVFVLFCVCGGGRVNRIVISVHARQPPRRPWLWPPVTRTLCSSEKFIVGGRLRGLISPKENTPPQNHFCAASSVSFSPPFLSCGSSCGLVFKINFSFSTSFCLFIFSSLSFSLSFSL